MVGIKEFRLSPGRALVGQGVKIKLAREDAEDVHPRSLEIAAVDRLNSKPLQYSKVPADNCEGVWRVNLQELDGLCGPLSAPGRS